MNDISSFFVLAGIIFCAIGVIWGLVFTTQGALIIISIAGLLLLIAVYAFISLFI